MNLTFFAGFVCNYQFAALYSKYFSAFGITFCLAALVYLLGIRKIQNTRYRRISIGALVVFVLIAGHLLYMLMIGGDFFGCGVFPWVSNPDPNQI